jgi:putative ABC transport system permease protein
MFDRLRKDFRYAARMLAKKPAFAFLAVLTLAVGIGANTAMFTIANAVLLRPLPYSNPDELVRIRGGSSAPDISDLRQRSQTLLQIGGYRDQFFDLTTGAEAERIIGAFITGELFSLLQAKPLIGRLINPSDDIAKGPHVVVLSESFWRTRFKADRQIAGKKISLNGIAYTILGVVRSPFSLPRINVEVYAPLNAESSDEAGARGAHTLAAIARLRPQIDIQQAQADLDRISKQLEALYPEENTDRRFVIMGLQDYIVRDVRKTLWMLLGAVGFVLLIACTNVANLLMANSTARKKELAIRAAIGATRRTLVQQLLCEFFVLGLLGSILGFFAALWLAEAAVALSPPDLLPTRDLSIDWRVLSFTTGISLLSALIFGLLPALQSSRVEVDESLKERTIGEGRTSPAVRNLLAAAEFSLALILLVGAGLLLRSLYLLTRVDPGFDYKNVLTLNVTPPINTYGEIAKRTQFFIDVLERIKRIPGVESVGATSDLPFGMGSSFHNFEIFGRPPLTPGTEPEIYSRSINTDYFSAMRIPLRAGRTFTEQDDASSEPVVIVNDAAVRKHFRGENPIGQKVRWARDEDAKWMTIVGVVADVKHAGLNSADYPALYNPFPQEIRYWKSWMNIAVRTKLDPGTVAGVVRKQIAEVDRTIPAANVATIEMLMEDSFADRRFHLTLLGCFAAVALLLSATGVYGVLSQSVSQRMHEMGVRLALGAAKADILKLVVSQGMRLTFYGLIAGIAGSLALTRILKTMLFGISPTDIPTFALVSLLLIFVAFLASYVPARRATRVDPMRILRYE